MTKLPSRQRRALAAALREGRADTSQHRAEQLEAAGLATVKGRRPRGHRRVCTIEPTDEAIVSDAGRRLRLAGGGPGRPSSGLGGGS